jgi:hypothetical protein
MAANTKNTGMLVLGNCPALKERLKGIIFVILVTSALDFRQYFDISFPHLILIAGSAILDDDYAYVRQLLPNYLSLGGTLMFGYDFPSIYWYPFVLLADIDRVFQELNIPWTTGQIYNGRFLHNPASLVPTRGRDLPDYYGAHGVMLKGARPEERIYVYVVYSQDFLS